MPEISLPQPSDRGGETKQDNNRLAMGTEGWAQGVHYTFPSIRKFPKEKYFLKKDVNVI